MIDPPLTDTTTNTPLISIIVPVYGAEALLPRCLDSLLRQEYAPLEIILVEDGSPDNSAAICDRYAAADPRIRVFHQPNAGASAARNKGMELAQGEYLCFVDADDDVDKHYLRHFADGLGPEVDLVFQGICEIRGGKRTRKVPPRQIFGSGQLTEGISVINRQSMFGYVCNKLYRRSIIMAKGLRFRRDISLSEDRIFALEYMLHVRKMQLMDTCAYNYYLQTTGLTMRRRRYDELKAAADANLQAALTLLQQQPSAAFERDTHRMYVMAAMDFLTSLFRTHEPRPRCVTAFRECQAITKQWLPLYQPDSHNAQVVYLALHMPAPAAYMLTKLYWKLKRLKHELSA